jgi:hypothetical protein
VPAFRAVEGRALCRLDGKKLSTADEDEPEGTGTPAADDEDDDDVKRRPVDDVADELAAACPSTTSSNLCPR